jgi:antitoxin (DNA-binding transcriptional repressor) of toxin-antitoxin stability system
VAVDGLEDRCHERFDSREAGEEIVTTRRGKPVARIVPPPAQNEKPPLLDALKGKIWIAPDFDELGPERDEYVK